MALFDFLKSNDINEGVKEYEGVAGAVLLDVRTPQEYREGHIPGSRLFIQSADSCRRRRAARHASYNHHFHIKVPPFPCMRQYRLYFLHLYIPFY